MMSSSRRPVRGRVAFVILRCTARLAAMLGGPAVMVDESPTGEDWYGNVLVVERRKVLLLMHADTLFPVVLAGVRKTDLRDPGRFVVMAITAALEDEGLGPDALSVLDPADVRFARTASRSCGRFNDPGRDGVGVLRRSRRWSVGSGPAGDQPLPLRCLARARARLRRAT